MRKLNVVMLGTGSPRPNLERAGSAQILYIDDFPILIDCGDRTITQLLKANIFPQDVKQLWLTHLHSDHILGYFQFLLGGWIWGRKELTVYGPVGTKKFHNLVLEIFQEDIAYRTSLGRSSKGILDVNIIEIKDSGVVCKDMSFSVIAERMDHNVTTYAYRFQVGGSSVVFSGDTAPTENLINLSKGANAIVHDCCLTISEKSTINNPELQSTWYNLQKEHCTPTQAAYTAKQAGTRKLILTHFMVGADEKKVYQEASLGFSGEIIVAKDLQVINID